MRKMSQDMNRREDQKEEEKDDSFWRLKYQKLENTWEEEKKTLKASFHLLHHQVQELQTIIDLEVEGKPREEAEEKEDEELQELMEGFRREKSCTSRGGQNTENVKQMRRRREEMRRFIHLYDPASSASSSPTLRFKRRKIETRKDAVKGFEKRIKILEEFEARMKRKLDDNDPVTEDGSTRRREEGEGPSSWSTSSSATIISSPVAFENRDKCDNCSKEYIKRQSTSDSLLCPLCQKWEHCHHFPENICNDTESDECFYCLKLKEAAVEEDRDQDEVAALDAMISEWEENRKKGILEFKDVKQMMEQKGQSEGYLREAPEGHWREWTFVWNIFDPQKQINVKLGDCVYLKREKQRGFDVVRVQYLIRDTRGIPWISCYHFYNSDQIKRWPSQMIHPQQLWLVPVNGWAPLSTVSRLCCCLSQEEYETGKPRGFLEKDVYFVRHSYDYNTLAQTLLIALDYVQCKQSLVFKERERKVGDEMRFELKANNSHKKKTNPSEE